MPEERRRPAAGRLRSESTGLPGKVVGWPRFLPRQERRGAQAERERKQRRAGLQQKAGRQNRRAEEISPPAHRRRSYFHSITTNKATMPAEKTSAGTVNGLVQWTLRTQPCFSVRISCICLRASASCSGFPASSAARFVSSSALLSARRR